MEYYWYPRRNNMRAIIEKELGKDYTAYMAERIIQKDLEAYGPEVTKAMAVDESKRVFRAIERYLTKEGRQFVSWGYPEYCLQLEYGCIQMIYNDYMCIVHHADFPNVLALFVSEKATFTKGIGKGFMTELNILSPLYRFRGNCTNEVILLINVPLQAYFPIVMSVLRDDMYQKEPIPRNPKKSVPKKKEVKKYKVEYFPAIYNAQYANIMNRIRMVNYEWSFAIVHGLLRAIGPGTGTSEHCQIRIRIYSKLRESLTNRDERQFIQACTQLAAYHYQFYNTKWGEKSSSNPNAEVFALDYENSMEVLYVFKALIARLKREDFMVYSYLMNQTRIFDKVDFDNRPASWYLKESRKYKKKRVPIFGSYDNLDPAWVESGKWESSHSPMFEEESVAKAYDELMKDCYRRDIYSEEDYDELFKYELCEREYMQ